MSLPIYSTGTVSVAAGGTNVTGAGVMWSGINVKQGDFISIAGLAEVLITEVTDAANLKIAPWQGAAQSNAPYLIYQNYVGRVVGVAAAEDVGEMLEKLHVDGLPFIVGADETVPDPSYGDEGQLAFKPSTGEWWTKQGGVWVPSAGLTALGYGGTSSTPMLIGLSPPTKVFTTQTSLAYNGARVRAASAANLNNWMEGVATYSGTTLTMAADLVNNSGTYSDWLFSIAGTKGAVGATGATGPMGPEGPPGATGTGAGNVTGPVGAVHERIAVFNGTSGTIIKDGGKTITELGAGTIIVNDTPPVGSPVGTLWWESDTGNLYILYNDGSSTQWVMAVPATSAASIGAVAYTPQSPTVPQQTQARANIGAASASDITAATAALVETVRIQKITASGTYTPSTGMLYAVVECWGGGGGGGATSGTSTTETKVAGGGGGGGYSRSVLSATVIGASKAVVIGAGGTNPFGNGGAGGQTTFGATLVVSNGGSGGVAGSYSTPATAGGAAGTGDLAAPGPSATASGGDVAANMNIGVGGTGASTAVGGGGSPGLSSGGGAAGSAATGYASGGGGSSTCKAVASPLGGLGAPGLCVITEYCSQ